MNIIITGGGGQLGFDCCQFLQSSHTVHSYESKDLDITKREMVRTVLHNITPDVVINCAAYTHVDGCETNWDKCLQVNCSGPEILAQETESVGAKLIHVSTDYVFDGLKTIPNPYYEDDLVNPLSCYGKSKLQGEESIRKYTDNYMILRTAWLFGIHGNNFLKTILRLAMADAGRTIRVVDDQYGSLTSTLSLARQIGQLLTNEIKGTVHTTANGYGTWYEGAKFFLETIDVPYSLEPCTTEEYPTPAPRPANSILVNSRLKQEGMDVMPSWQEDVETFIRQHRSELIAESEQLLNENQ